MAKVANFLYCLKSITSETEASAMGILCAITPDYIPGAFSFSIICSIVDLEVGDHSVILHFIKPSGVELLKIEGQVPFQVNEQCNLPNDYVGINISADLQNVVFEESGLYKTIVEVNNIELGTYEIFVKGKNEGR